MLRKLMVFGLLLLLILGVNGYSNNVANVVINSPTSGQEFTVGDEIVIDIEDDLNMFNVSIWVVYNNNYFKLGSRYFSPQVHRYRTTWDTTGFPAGSYSIRAGVDSLITPTEADYTTKTVTVILNPSDSPMGDEDAKARVIRSAPDEIGPGGQVGITLTVFPRSEFTGIVLTEQIPPQLSFSHITPTTIDYKYDRNTGIIKFALKSSTAMEITNFTYLVNDNGTAAPETEMPLDGNWEILGERGSTMGKNSIKFAGISIPRCPLSDTTLLGYINRWAAKDLDPSEDENDRVMQQIIARWKGC